MSVDRLAALRGLRPERVCLIKPSSLGDVVHALPVLSSLRALWPDAHLAWVVNRGLRGSLDGHPDLDEVIPFDRSQRRPQSGRDRLDLPIPDRLAAKAVRPGDRPAGAAPIRGHGRGHRCPGPGGPGRLARGLDAFLHAPDQLARPRVARGRPASWGRRGLRRGHHPPSVPGRHSARTTRPGPGRYSKTCRAAAGDQRRGPLADQAVAARAFRERRPTGRPGTRGGPRPRRRPGGPAARGCPAGSRSGRSTSLDLCGRTTLPQLAASPPRLTSSSPTIPGRSTWPRRPARRWSASTPAPALQDRPLRPRPRGRAELRLVRSELRQDLPPARMHGRADPRTRLAGRLEAARTGDARAEDRLSRSPGRDV